MTPDRADQLAAPPVRCAPVDSGDRRVHGRPEVRLAAAAGEQRLAIHL